MWQRKLVLSFFFEVLKTARKGPHLAKRSNDVWEKNSQKSTGKTWIWITIKTNVSPIAIEISNLIINRVFCNVIFWTLHGFVNCSCTSYLALILSKLYKILAVLVLVFNNISFLLLNIMCVIIFYNLKRRYFTVLF